MTPACGKAPFDAHEGFGYWWAMTRREWTVAAYVWVALAVALAVAFILVIGIPGWIGPLPRFERP